jgi:hypothetical protein
MKPYKEGVRGIFMIKENPEPRIQNKNKSKSAE